MIVVKVATIFFFAFSVQAEKKVELQDIEEDNLRSEKENNYDNSDDTPTSGSGTGPGLVPLEFLKSGLLRYFENPTASPQQQQHRYVHQYAVTEPPESQPVVKNQYTSPVGQQQAMVGYLSNVPMQIYLVPQYYSDQPVQPTNPHASTQYQSPRVATYQTAPEAVQTQTNYIEVPAYTQPTGKPYTQQFTPAVTYHGYPTHPTVAPPHPTVASALKYQAPVVQYTPPITQQPHVSKTYYSRPQYSESNSVYDDRGYEDDQRHYSTQTETPYHKPNSEYPRHYNSRTPYRDDYRGPHTNSISELPHPNPLLLRAPPPHLAHIPKILPMHRPSLTKPHVYHGTSGSASSSFTSQPHEYYSPSYFKKRPTSLLDSYIPSSVQIEYLKRGLIKEPLAVYDALASGRLPHPIPKYYERGFLPNQMYHTAAGGVTFGHHKRAPKSDTSQ